MTTTSNPFLHAALAAVSRGWHVVPLRPGTKKPAFHGYDRCPRTGPCRDGHRGWEQRALADPEMVRWYWTSHRGRHCNVGIATGPSRLLVVDLDVPKPGDDPRPAEWDRPDVHTGQDVFLLVCHEAGQVPPVDTYTVATASGGSHLYYAVPNGIELRNTGGAHGAGLGWKVDTRAGGGQVVAAGSILAGQHGSGYTIWLDAPVAPVPGWLCDRLAAPPPAPLAAPVQIRHRSAFVDAAVRDTIARIRATRTNRNAALYGGAVSLGQLVAGGQLSEREHRAALMDAASGHIAVDAYSARQAEQTIASGLRKGMQHGRQVVA